MRIKTTNITAKYDIFGCYEYKRWTGAVDYVNVHIKTDEAGFREIQANPLQNYAGCSAKEVLFVHFFCILKKESGTVTAHKKRKEIQACVEVAPIIAGVSRRTGQKGYITIIY